MSVAPWLTCAVCIVHCFPGAWQEVPTAVDGCAVPCGRKDGQ